MKATLPLLVVLALMGAAATASAQLSDAQSPITSVVEVRFSGWNPNIDDDFDASPGPYEQMFGNRSPVLFELEYGYQFYQGVGSLSVAGNVGLARVRAKALNSDGSRTADTTRFTTIPLRLGLVYRFDYLAQRWNIPFAFAFKLGYDHYFWTVRDSQGRASVTDDSGGTIDGRGQTHGYHYAIGFHLLLDWFTPQMARSFDLNTGVNNTYFFAEYMRAVVDDFGADDSWDLGTSQVTFGLAFEF